MNIPSFFSIYVYLIYNFCYIFYRLDKQTYYFLFLLKNNFLKFGEQGHNIILNYNGFKNNNNKCEVYCHCYEKCLNATMKPTVFWNSWSILCTKKSPNPQYPELSLMNAEDERTFANFPREITRMCDVTLHPLVSLGGAFPISLFFLCAFPIRLFFSLCFFENIFF